MFRRGELRQKERDDEDEEEDGDVEMVMLMSEICWWTSFFWQMYSNSIID